MKQLETNTGPTAKNHDYYLNLWNNIVGDLISHYGEDLYKSWFAKIHFHEVVSEKEILLSAPSNFIRDWVKSKYFEIILRLWQHYDDRIHSIDLITNTNVKESNITNLTAKSLINSSKASNDAAIEPQDLTASLDARFTFENFVVGTPNELAYSAALAVAESESAVEKSNPLFLYGGVGLGKTHLMHAISWHSRIKNPDRKILYISAEKFMYRFIKALRNKDIMSFKDEFRSVDVLMIDDIQFICGKDNTQEEFFHTFNTIIDNNKQMVISCDRSPTDLDNIEERIKSRLGWGLVADVHSTTYELRLGILQSKLEKMNVKVAKNVIEFLASKITSNVRELEGALNKVIAHSTLIGSEINLENTQDILRDLLRSNDRVVTINEIQKTVAERYNIKSTDMTSARRSRAIVRPRQVAMYLSKALTVKSLAEIGKKFGKKDHTTVIHAVKKIDELLLTDHEMQEEIRLLKRVLQNT